MIDRLTDATRRNSGGKNATRQQNANRSGPPDIVLSASVQAATAAAEAIDHMPHDCNGRVLYPGDTVRIINAVNLARHGSAVWNIEGTLVRSSTTRVFVAVKNPATNITEEIQRAPKNVRLVSWPS